MSLIVNVCLLSFFKYNDFINEFLEYNKIFELNKIIFPLGISFYIFSIISLLIDSYKDEIKEIKFLDYCSFILFFPKLMQGPITYAKEIIPQFNNIKEEKINWTNINNGLFIFSIGLLKKVLLADNLGHIVNYGYSNILQLNSYEALLTIVSYTFQIYFDFSGYCDMACGVSKMINIELPINFNSPYKACNISDFWKRWHITLTRFLTKYVYISLGGNRKGQVLTYINILIVFIISGLWHGTGINFFIWGLIHGFAMILYRAFKTIYIKIPIILQWLLTFVFINVTWVFFRAESLSKALLLFKQLFIGEFKFKINPELTETLLMPTIINIPSRFIPFNILISVFLCLILVAVLVLQNSNELKNKFTSSCKYFIITYLFFTLGILSITGVNSFLYINF